MSKNTIKVDILTMATEKDMNDAELSQYFRGLADLIDSMSKDSMLSPLDIKIEIKGK